MTGKVEVASRAAQKAYRDQLPKKRMGSGALFVDGKRRVLLVEPAYKPVWEIPGGVVEKDESPKACCQREVAEELGLKLEIGRLLLVDYNAPTDEKTESLMFLFDGGILSQAAIGGILLQDQELLSFRFFDIEQLPENLSPALRQRVVAAYQRRADGGDAYFENP